MVAVDWLALAVVIAAPAFSAYLTHRYLRLPRIGPRVGLQMTVRDGRVHWTAGSAALAQPSDALKENPMGEGGENICDAPSRAEPTSVEGLAAEVQTLRKRLAVLESALLYIGETDWHYRTPPKPKPDGGMRGWAGRTAVRALTGRPASFLTDADVRAMITAAPTPPAAGQPVSGHTEDGSRTIPNGGGDA